MNDENNIEFTSMLMKKLFHEISKNKKLEMENKRLRNLFNQQ